MEWKTVAKELGNNKPVPSSIFLRFHYQTLRSKRCLKYSMASFYHTTEYGLKA